MVFQRGDIVLIPFPFTDLSAVKTRPAVIISSPLYHNARSELLLAYVSSQVTKAHPPIDYLLLDWSAAGLPKPSFVRPKIASVEPTLVVHAIGQLSERDLAELDRRLRRAMSLTRTALADVMAEINLADQPPDLVQLVAEKAVIALTTLVQTNVQGVDTESVRLLLNK